MNKSSLAKSVSAPSQKRGASSGRLLSSPADWPPPSRPQTRDQSRSSSPATAASTNTSKIGNPGARLADDLKSTPLGGESPSADPILRYAPRWHPAPKMRNSQKLGRGARRHFLKHGSLRRPAPERHGTIFIRVRNEHLNIGPPPTLKNEGVGGAILSRIARFWNHRAAGEHRSTSLQPQSSFRYSGAPHPQFSSPKRCATDNPKSPPASSTQRPSQTAGRPTTALPRSCST